MLSYTTQYKIWVKQLKNEAIKNFPFYLRTIYKISYFLNVTCTGVLFYLFLELIDLLPEQDA